MALTILKAPLPKPEYRLLKDWNAISGDTFVDESGTVPVLIIDCRPRAIRLDLNEIYNLDAFTSKYRRANFELKIINI